MAQNRRAIWDDRQSPDPDGASRRHVLNRPSYLFVFTVFAALVCGGCETPPPLPNPPGPKTAVRLAPGDTIKVAYADESVPDQTQKIRKDGKVSLPFIGEVTAADKRPMDFQRELVGRYEGQIQNSEVLVTLENAAGHVIVSGFAHKPGPISFDRPKTVYETVMEAGGATDYGSLSNVHLTRMINGEQRTEIINLRPTVHGKPTLPIYVQDGDVIYISRNWF
jgi:protein involved in polysaccharide export with SLBB domain